MLFCDSSKGWCVDAESDFAAGDFICEYLGEVITTMEALKRLAFYDENAIGHALLVESFSFTLVLS